MAAESQTTVAARLEMAYALLNGARADLLRGEEAMFRAQETMRQAIDRSQQARRMAVTARGVAAEIFGEIEYLSWITEAAADAEISSWDCAA